MSIEYKHQVCVGVTVGLVASYHLSRNFMFTDHEIS